MPKEMDRNGGSEVVERDDIIYICHMYSYNDVYINRKIIIE